MEYSRLAVAGGRGLPDQRGRPPYPCPARMELLLAAALRPLYNLALPVRSDMAFAT